MILNFTGSQVIQKMTSCADPEKFPPGICVFRGIFLVILLCKYKTFEFFSGGGGGPNPRNPALVPLMDLRYSIHN